MCARPQVTVAGLQQVLVRIFSDGEDAAMLTAKVEKVLAALGDLSAACLGGFLEVCTT